MAYRLFHDVFPAVAEQETRTLTILPEARSSLPVEDYGFLEMFCDEPGCDCRRVFFSVVSSARQEIEAVVAWGWEDTEFYAAWMKDNDPQVVANLKGPVLNFGSPATALAPALLELTRTVLLQDTHYVERIKRHDQMFRQRIEDRHPGHRTPARGKTLKRTRHSTRTGRNVKDEHEHTRQYTKTETSTGPAWRDSHPRRSVAMPQKPPIPHASEKPSAISLAHYEITTDPIHDRRYQRLPRHVKEAI